ncbi:nuclear apoptosis-inducing factor 1-like [Mercenaria mercenaria]|uniref:nuclear apoptosis-inducing factor 1-like n=1 Tax=Mercenaria mercenaria TaxID=6596 RepID=UPI00234E9948|nr:nuclear apoptosis-inducing factor 1-like [Mercenaria mercenaria]
MHGTRGAFSPEERDVLVSQCQQSEVATGKFSSTLTAAGKARFWTNVTESVNSVSKCTRSIEQVKKKWVDLKSQTKKKRILHMQEVRKTGGGPAPVLDLETWESQVLKSIPLCSVEGIKNGADTFLGKSF